MGRLDRPTQKAILATNYKAELIDLLPGDECAGVVTAVGRGVKGLKAGDKVVAVAPGCFASHVVLPEAFVG